MIRFTEAQFERPHLRDKFDLMLGVVATFEILIEGRVLYTEVMFPIVELRVTLAAWMDDGLPRGADFEFKSMEGDDPDMVWVRRQPTGGWRIGALDQEYAETFGYSSLDVAEPVRRYIRSVDQWVLTNLHVDVAGMIGG